MNKDETENKQTIESKKEMPKNEMMSGGSYARFAAMVGALTIVMFGLMYLNTYALDHVFFQRNALLYDVCDGRGDGGDNAFVYAQYV